MSYDSFAILYNGRSPGNEDVRNRIHTRQSGSTVPHKEWLTPSSINNPMTAYVRITWSGLSQMRWEHSRGELATNDKLIFNEEGNLIERDAI